MALPCARVKSLDWWSGGRGGMLRLLGWRLGGQFPDYPKAVVIGYPHTSNLDGFIMLLTAWGLWGEAAVDGQNRDDTGSAGDDDPAAGRDGD